MRSSTETLILVLNRVGDRRVRNDRKLWSAFDSAAERYPDVFGAFKCHPQYGDCPVLSEALSILHLGGSIGYWSSTLNTFSATDVVFSDGVKKRIEQLTEDEKAAVEHLASKVKDLQ